MTSNKEYLSAMYKKGKQILDNELSKIVQLSLCFIVETNQQSLRSFVTEYLSC